MPPYAYLLIAGGSFSWLLPFLLQQRRRDAPSQVDRRARWGMILLAAAYSLLWQSSFWKRSPESWHVLLACLLFILASGLAWASLRALGRHWRIDASLSQDHELVRSGIYSVVRHPIYSSMWCVFLATGLIVAPLPLLALSAGVFLIGTEIRVRVEDRLLAARFGAQFEAYRLAVPAYVPRLTATLASLAPRP